MARNLARDVANFTQESVGEVSITLRTDDDTSLAGTWFGSTQAPHVAVVIVPGAGIPARFYHGLARHLASDGAAVLAFDYRGIGASRDGSIRRLRAGMDDWAKHDIAAALKEARTRYPRAKLGAVAHSVGTLLVGGAPGADEISRAVFLGPHTGYWRDYARRWRVPLFAMWHVALPVITRTVGFFPGRALRLGEDLPKQAALDWAERRSPQLVRTADHARRFGPSMPRYAEFRARTLAISLADDAFAPPGAARQLLQMYPAIRVVQQVVSPRDFGARRLGHLGFLRRRVRAILWPRISQWLLSDAAAMP